MVGEFVVILLTQQHLSLFGLSECHWNLLELEIRDSSSKSNINYLFQYDPYGF